MRCLSVAVAVLVCWLAAISWAQTGAPAAATDAQLSPGAAYEQAVRPVEITHRSIENWSDIETGALAVAIKQAQTAFAVEEAAARARTGILRTRLASASTR